MRHQQKMGTVFLLAVVLSSLQLSGFAFAGQILLPENPKPVAPPSRGEAGAREDFERKRQHLNNKIKKQTPEPESASLKRDRKLLEESLKPVALNVGMTVSLLYNLVQTSGDERQNYTADPSAHVALFYRPTKSRKSSQLNLWLGVRGYFVSGTGTFEDARGRYSFAYYGPMIGLGKFDPAPASVGASAAEAPSEISDHITNRNGYFALLGVAAQTRQSTREVGSEEPDDDFDNKPVAFDSPGLWAEVWYANLHYNAISLQTFAGIQTGAQKYFVYIGIGVGGWR